MAKPTPPPALNAFDRPDVVDRESSRRGENGQGQGEGQGRGQGQDGQPTEGKPADDSKPRSGIGVNADAGVTGTVIINEANLDKDGETDGKDDGEREKRDEASKEDPKKKDSIKPKGTKKVATWKRSEIVPNTSRLMIGDKEELPLKGMQAQVRIDGFRARVVLDFHFYNDRGRQFEGTFKLRLPNGASPYFFAFGEQQYKSPQTPRERPIFFRVGDSQELQTSPAQIMQTRTPMWTEPKEA
ncbi:MAG: hypothetical protein N2C14_26910, partial [Planctomycetales bacterium]